MVRWDLRAEAGPPGGDESFTSWSFLRGKFAIKEQEGPDVAWQERVEGEDGTTMASNNFRSAAGESLRLRDLYCREHQLAEDTFVAHFLERVLHPNAAIVYPVAKLFVPDFDKDDQELILDLGACDSLDDVHRILGRLPYYYARWQRLRLKFRLRVSSRRVLAKVAKFRGSGTGAAA